MKPDIFGPLAGALAKHEIPVGFWVTMAFSRQQDESGHDMVRVVTYGLLPFIGREVECLHGDDAGDRDGGVAE